MHCRRPDGPAGFVWLGTVGRAVLGRRRFSAQVLFAHRRFYTRCQTKLIPTVLIQSGPAAPFVHTVTFCLSTARDHVTFFLGGP